MSSLEKLGYEYQGTKKCENSLITFWNLGYILLVREIQEEKTFWKKLNLNDDHGYLAFDEAEIMAIAKLKEKKDE